MSRYPIVPALLLLATAFSACIGGEEGRAFGVLDAPVWESGYAFSYNVTTSVETVYEENGERETDSENSGPFGARIEVINTTYVQDGVPLYIVATAMGGLASMDHAGDEVPFAMGGLVGVRKSDLMDVASRYGEVVRCEGGQQNCVTTIDDLSFGPLTKAIYLDFPLSRGKSWTNDLSSEDDVEMDLDGVPIEVREENRVRGAVDIDTPLGRIEAVQVEHTLRAIGLEQLRNEALAEARAEGIQVDRFDLVLNGVTSTFYSEKYQTIAKETVSLVVGVDIRAKGPDGQRYDYYSRADVRSEQILTGATYVPGPERDLGAMGAIVGGLYPIKDPTGSAYEPAGYSLQIVQSAEVVNAADAPTVHFEAVVSGMESLPPGHTLEWTLRDATQAVVAQGDGPLFDFAADTPGAYSVELIGANEDDRVSAVAASSLIANYDAEVSIVCETAAAEPLLPGCGAIQVPVRPGIESLTVDATPTGPATAASSGSLRLEDSASHSISDNSRAGGRYEITLDDFSSFSPEGDDWTLDYNQRYAVAEDVTYGVHLTFGPAELATMVDDGSLADAPWGRALSLSLPLLGRSATGGLLEGDSLSEILDDIAMERLHG